MGPTIRNRRVARHHHGNPTDSQPDPNAPRATLGASVSRTRTPPAWSVPLAAGALALAARAWAVTRTPRYAPHHDDHSYLMHALALATTHAYPVFRDGGHRVPTAYRPPGFPVVLAAAHVVFGGGLAVERLTQVVIGAAVAVLTYAVGRQIWGPRTATAAAILVALSPVLVLFDASLIS